jgi:DNA-binding MarR family transcriptional regulator/N-acetylglutamate synthase-like GNAT family acetyltransferase
MPTTPERAEQVRDFNRFYTRRIGALGDAHLGSPFSLTEVRVLYELAHRTHPTAAEIAAALGIDRGQLSRTLRAFNKRGLITTTKGVDRRQSLLSLTAGGKKAFAPLDRHARDAVIKLLEPLSPAGEQRLLDAMHVIRETLGDDDTPANTEPFILRQHRPGDIGWIVHRHGALYWKEYGYDERFEALVAKVVAGFVENWKPERERCWIAERGGEIVGSVFVVQKTKTIAQLRLLLVEPSARGMGIGRRLVDEVVRFARETGYRKVQLWTQSELKAARKIYTAAGFRIVGTEGHESFGKKLDAEVWELDLN